MAELKEQQKIVFKHPINKQICVGIYYNGIVFYVPENPLDGLIQIPYSYITEWCDASEAWNALTQHKPIAGNFEWSHPEN